MMDIEEFPVSSNIDVIPPQNELPAEVSEEDRVEDKVEDRIKNIVEDIVEPIVMTYDLGTLPPVDTGITLRGPNFKIDVRLNSSVPTAFKSYNDILQAETTSSYQRLLSKLKNYDI